MIKSKTIFILYTVYIFNYIHLHLFTIIYSKQNPEFAQIMHDAISNMLLCIQFNIVYQYIGPFYEIYDALTENGYTIYHNEFFHNFRMMVSKLEHLEKNKYFEIDMIV